MLPLRISTVPLLTSQQSRAENRKPPPTGSARSEFTRAVGVYPDDPREDFSPELVVDKSTYRNLALLRPAYHSSRYDYNLTAQLVTDGIKDTHLPKWVATSTSSRGALPKTGRELVLDHSRTSSVEIFEPRCTLSGLLCLAPAVRLQQISTCVGRRRATIRRFASYPRRS